MILAALLLAEAAALVLAVALAWQLSPKAGNKSDRWQQIVRSPHAPVVMLVAFALVDDVALEILRTWLRDAPRPFAGWHRAGYHLSTAIVLGWPAALAATTWRAFGARNVTGPEECHRRPGMSQPPADAARGHKIRRRSYLSTAVIKRAGNPARLVLAAWALALAGLVAAHPLGRARTALVLHVWEGLMVAAAGAAIVRAWGRPWSRAAVAVGLLVVVEMVIAILGPFGHDVFADWDRLARVPYAIGFGVLAGLQARWLLGGRDGQAKLVQ